MSHKVYLVHVESGIVCIMWGGCVLLCVLCGRWIGHAGGWGGVISFVVAWEWFYVYIN